MPFPRKSRVGLADDDADSANDYGEVKDLAEHKQKAQAAREVVIVVPEGETEGRYHAMAMSARKKMGHSFCGVCCDMRRTVIALNIMILFLVVASFACLALIEEILVDEGPGAERNDFVHLWMDLLDLTPNNLTMNPRTVASLLLSCVVAGVGIAGAVNYNAWLLLIAALSYVVDIGYGIVNLDSVPILAGLFLLYPHIVLIVEIGTGTMTPDNYPNEERECLANCCV